MSRQLMLTPEQTDIVLKAGEEVEVRNSQGVLVGHIRPTEEALVIAEAFKRSASDGPFLTTQQVLDSLREAQVQ